MLFEFAISEGEGTLIDYGVCPPLSRRIEANPNGGDSVFVHQVHDGLSGSIVVRRVTTRYCLASPDCQTGQ